MMKFAYPKEYFGFKPIDEQVDSLANALGVSKVITKRFIKEELPSLSFPKASEGYIAFPSVNAIARRHIPRVWNPIEKYHFAIRYMFTKIERSRKGFLNNFDSMMSHNIRRSRRTLAALDLVMKRQKGDILIIPAQFGILHGGLSPSAAEKYFVGHESLPENLRSGDEFSLDLLMICSMVFTHPNRYVCFEQLHTECLGDEFVPDVCDGSGYPFSLGILTDRLELYIGSHVNADKYCGVVSGFIP